MLYGNDLWWRSEPSRPSRLLVSGGMYFIPEGGCPPTAPPPEYLNEIRSHLPDIATNVRPDSIVDGSFETCAGGSLITPDARPILDASAATPAGLVIAAGVVGGISMSPFTGAAVRALVTDDSAPVSLEPFRIDRFDTAEQSFQVHSIRQPTW